jgi:hypothetical protein
MIKKRGLERKAKMARKNLLNLAQKKYLNIMVDISKTAMILSIPPSIL